MIHEEGVQGEEQLNVILRCLCRQASPPDRGGTGPSDAPAAPGARENGGREATAKVGAAVARVDRAALIVLLRK